MKTPYLSRRRLCLALLISLYALPLFPQDQIEGEPSVIDLRGTDFSRDSETLSGTWEFYRDALLFPGDRIPDNPERMPVPGEWSLDGRYSSRGYGTYRTRVLLPPDAGRTGMRIGFTWNQYRIFINGRLAADNGDAAAERRVNRNRQAPTVLLLPEDQDLEIILQVSNYDDLQGGILDAPEVGGYEMLTRNKNRKEIFEAFLFGALLITGLLYISFFMNKRDDLPSLFFGLFSTVLALRTILYGEHILLLIFPNLPAELEATLGHLTFYLALPLFLKFITLSYPFKRSRMITRPFYIISGIYVLLALFTSHRIYVRFLSFYQLTGMASGVVIVVLLISHAARGSKAALITLSGFVVLLGATVNDILHTRETIQSFHMVPLGMAAFIMSQAALLSWNIGRAFSRSEALSRELSITNESFRRFVPEEFLKYLKKNSISDVRLGDHVQMEMTVMFCDIRDFTTLSENLTPHENFMFLNSYLERIGPVIREYDGFIDKYVGDGIMALFPGTADSAVKAALKMQEILKIYNGHRNSCGYESIRIGIGINTGSLMLGTIGENERMDSTVISDAVNICARMESVTKEYGLNIALSRRTFSLLTETEDLEVRSIGRISLKGKKEPVPVYELFSGDSPEIIARKKALKSRFESAVDLYDRQDYRQAEILFSSILEELPEDETSRIYLQKVRLAGLC